MRNRKSFLPKIIGCIVGGSQWRNECTVLIDSLTTSMVMMMMMMAWHGLWCQWDEVRKWPKRFSKGNFMRWWVCLLRGGSVLFISSYYNCRQWDWEANSGLSGLSDRIQVWSKPSHRTTKPSCHLAGVTHSCQKKTIMAFPKRSKYE